MRHWLVQELGSELLGPRGGSHETVQSDPLLLYSLGVLSPPSPPRSEENSQQADLSLDDLALNDSPGSQEGGDSGFHETPAFNPGLDPKSYPNSMGLSFTCLSDGDPPALDLAVSYARYVPDGEGYSRVPRGAIVTIHGSGMGRKGKSLVDRIYLSPDGGEIGDSPVLRVVEDEDEAESMLFLRMRRLDGGMWAVTAVLSTMIPHEPEWDTRYERMIFQPEIRIRSRVGTEVKAPDVTYPDGPSNEDEVDDLLYSGRRQVARGLLCSATWREFDPQDISDEDRERMKDEASADGLEILESPPFSWTDRNHPAFSEELEGLYPPDVRTEYMPMLNIPAPDMDPSDESRGTSADPVTPSWRNPITALELSEASSGPQIKAIIEPLIGGYREWIDHTFSQGEPLDRQLKEQAEGCLRRMERGLDMLERDPDARLAFNMANRAIHVSNLWASSGKNELSWRKFQIAFVLSTIESTTRRSSEDRANMDLLWVATGGGKTEAYLLLMAYVLCMRRIRPSMDRSGTARSRWQGVNVITRYTLRLLTIQQFRRTLGVITAMEWLRSQRDGDGWAPEGYQGDDNPWGEQQFGIGIWVGGQVTPNSLGHVTRGGTQNRAGIANRFRGDYFDPGQIQALENLEAGDRLTDDESKGAAEPAQVLSCPCCSSRLSFPRGSDDSPKVHESTIHWVVETSHNITMRTIVGRITNDPDLSEKVLSVSYTDHGQSIHTLSLDVRMDEGIEERSVEQLWTRVRELSNGSLSICSSRASRPGYFYLSRTTSRGTTTYYDFVIHCPSPSCELNTTSWSGRMPAGRSDGRQTDRSEPECTDEGFPVEIPVPWREGAETISRGIPIPAYTVDEQVYSRLPSVVISTVDKYARLPFEPRAGAMFGNADLHSELHGFVREGAKRANHDEIHGMSGVGRNNFRSCRITRLPEGLDPPELIIQDELHLIEGSLGSMVGFYETLIERLISDRFSCDSKPKYVASTATIKSAEAQVQCLFDRRLSLFPPKGRTWDDRGLIRERIEHSHSDGGDAGRLYIGMCPIGASGLAFQRDLYSTLLHKSQQVSGDRYWTTVGYYNALRELSGARALMEQDVLGALRRASERDETDRREINTLRELSGRLESTQLPIILDQLEGLERGDDGSVDVLLTTSMFGTGVDVNRLNVMVVAGQPKTTSQYIQATGRVGRKKGSLIATYLRASRPRDLDHFERFLSYHLRLNSSVEPVTVRPFSLPVITRAAGPLMVGWIRNSREAGGSGIPWVTTTSPSEWNRDADRPPEFDDFIDILQDRNMAQTEERRIRQSPPNAISDIVEGGQGRWELLSTEAREAHDPERPRQLLWDAPMRKTTDYLAHASEVVLGEELHVKQPDQHRAVYSPDHPAPLSLRSVDSQIGVEIRRIRGD